MSSLRSKSNGHTHAPPIGTSFKSRSPIVKSTAGRSSPNPTALPGGGGGRQNPEPRRWTAHGGAISDHSDFHDPDARTPIQRQEHEEGKRCGAVEGLLTKISATPSSTHGTRRIHGAHDDWPAGVGRRCPGAPHHESPRAKHRMTQGKYVMAELTGGLSSTVPGHGSPLVRDSTTPEQWLASWSLGRDEHKHGLSDNSRCDVGANEEAGSRGAPDRGRARAAATVPGCTAEEHKWRGCSASQQLVPIWRITGAAHDFITPWIGEND
jgi:hypothetical protein